MLLIYVSEPKKCLYSTLTLYCCKGAVLPLERERQSMRPCTYDTSAKYFSLNIYALQSLKRYSFSVSSIIPHFLQSSSFPSRKSLLWMWSASVIGMLMAFKLNFTVIKTTAALQPLSCGSFCPNRTGNADDEDNLCSAFTISPRLLKWEEGKGRLKRHEGKGTSRYQYITQLCSEF